MCGDPAQALQYLESAAAQFPQSAIVQAALIEAKKDLPQADAATRTAIDNLRKADPTSSLADHYDAYFRFKEGKVKEGIEALAAASEKDRFADQRLELMMSRYDLLLENGCSDGGALALSAFSLPFSHLPMLRETGQQVLQQAQAAHSAGQTELAIQTADYLARIGRNLSASGRFVIYDRVGMELQTAALEAKRRFHSAAGNSYQVGELDFQIGAIQARSAKVNDMAGAFGGILANMTDEGIVRYIESTLMHGEFSTLQSLTRAQ
jgi:tetratricopeptide (TPR) repeat protein